MAKAGYKIRNTEGIHFIIFAVVEWIDDAAPLIILAERFFLKVDLLF